MTFGPNDKPWVMMIYPSEVDKEIDGDKGWDFFTLGDLVFQANDLYTLQDIIIGAGHKKEKAIMYITDSMEEAIAAAQDVLGPIPDSVLDEFMKDL